MSSSKFGRVIRDYRFEKGDPSGLIDPMLEGTPMVVVNHAMSAALLDQARDEAERILHNARIRAEEIQQEAEMAGLVTGREAGRQEALSAFQAQAADAVRQSQALLDSITAQRTEILAGAESELVKLSLAIATKVIGDAAAAQTDVIAYLAHQAIAQLGNPGPGQVRLNPDDLRRMAPFWAQDTASARWELVPDERIALGGCIVTCGASQMDARPETQIELIGNTLLEKGA
jgi:flagellar assembly protein FliH